MPNPTQRKTHMLSHEAAKKANAQVSSMADYLHRFIGRPKDLRVASTDPLFVKADAAQKAMIELGIAIVMSSKPPNKTRWE